MRVSSFALTPTSLVFLAQLLVVLVIWQFLFLLAVKQDYQPWLRAQIRRVIGAFAVYGLLAVVLLVEESIAPSRRFLAGYLVNPLLALTLILWIEFAYYFPQYQPAWRTEVRIVRLLALLFLAIEVVFAVYRYRMLALGIVFYRPTRLDYTVAAVLLWSIIVLARQAVLTSRQAGGTARAWLSHLLHPGGRGVAARSFLLALALLWLAAIVDALTSLHPGMAIGRDLVVPILLLLGISSLAITYMNYFPEVSSLRAKVTVVAVVALLGALGLTGMAVAPALLYGYQAMHRDIYASDLRFVPDGRGGYTAHRLEEAPLPAGSAAVELDMTGVNAVEVTLPFPFPFAGEEWASIHVFEHGALTFAPTTTPINFEYAYGPVPALFANYHTPGELPGQSSRVLVATAPDRVVVTWHEIEGAQQDVTGAIVLQAILHRDGSFDLASQNVTLRTVCRTKGYRECSTWFAGLTPGLGRRGVEQVDFGTGAPIHVQATTATIQDFVEEFRLYMHEAMVPLAMLMLVATTVTLTGMRLFLRRVLVRPLQNLVAGLSEARVRNRFDLVLPVYYRDELGFATEAFNYMAGELSRLLASLEARVQQRTEELAASNQHLATEIARRKAVQAEIELLNHELEERVVRRTQDLLASQERFRQVIASISDHVFALRVLEDGSEENIYSSPRLAELAGLAESELDGNFFVVAMRLAHADDRQEVGAFWARLGVAGGGELEFRLCTAGGAIIWLRTSARVQQRGSERIIFGVTSDITQRKQAEQAAAEMRALAELDKLRTELIGNVSHELRTPLGLIKAASTTLLRQDVTFPPATQQMILQGISGESDRLEHLVANLLDIARLDQQRFFLHCTPTDLCDLLTKLVMAAQRKLEVAPGARHQVVLALPATPVVATLDALKYEQVVHNLLENAIRYSPAGGAVTLTLHASATACELRVADQGIGIAPDDLERIFDRFYRAHDARVQRIRGTGLGLAICREIVDAHGGTLLVESVPDQGSTFVVRLPLAPHIGPT